MLPATYRLSGVAVNWRRSIGRGGEAIVRPGTWNGGDVVVREIMIPTDSLPNHSTTLEASITHQVKKWFQLTRLFCKLVHREVITHIQLQHKNILPLLGVYQDDENDMPMMVLPFQERGGLLKYLKTVPPDNCLETVHKLVSSLSLTVTSLRAVD